MSAINFNTLLPTTFRANSYSKPSIFNLKVIALAGISLMKFADALQESSSHRDFNYSALKVDNRTQATPIVSPILVGFFAIITVMGYHKLKNYSPASIKVQRKRPQLTIEILALKLQLQSLNIPFQKKKLRQTTYLHQVALLF